MADSKDLLNKLDACESEIEKLFLCAAYGRIEGLIPQYHVLNYRIDFAVPEKMIAIEIDGHEYHKTKEQRTHDNQREREIKLALPTNWTVIRFTGSEIFQNATLCVDEVLGFINKNTMPHPNFRDNIYAFLRSIFKRKKEVPKNNLAKCNDTNESTDINLQSSGYWAGEALKLWDYSACFPFIDTSTINKDNYEKAIEYYNNAIVLDPSHTAWYYGKARICTALTLHARDMHIQGEFDRYFNATLETYQKAIKIDPSDACFLMEIGLFLNEFGKYEEANNAFDKAIKLKEKDEHDEHILHYSIEGKIRALNRIADTNPYDADIWYAIGNSWAKLEGGCSTAMCGAIRAYDKAIINMLNFVEAWYKKGVALNKQGRWNKLLIEAAFAMAEGRYYEAMKVYDDLIKLDPKYAGAWYNQGIALCSLGKYDEAIKAYDEAIRLDPKDGLVYYAKSVALKLLGKTSEAYAELAKSAEPR